jgi:hypothetical protein
MTRPRYVIFLATLGSLLTACSEAPKTLALVKVADDFIPTDATQRAKAPGVPWLQISFDVQRPPLEFGIDESRLRRAAADGWKVCAPTSPEWTGYLDMSAQPAQYTQTRTYVLYRDGILVTLIGMYNSANEASSVKKSDERDEKPVQHDFVIVEQTDDQKFHETAAHHNLQC